MSSKADIYPEPGGAFAFDNGKLIRVCLDMDSVGENMESMLWPLIEPALKRRRPITIKIDY